LIELVRFLQMPPQRPVPTKGPPSQLCHGPWHTSHVPWQSWLGVGPMLRRDVCSSSAGNSRTTESVDCGEAFLLFWNGGSIFIRMFVRSRNLICVNVTLYHSEWSIWFIEHQLDCWISDSGDWFCKKKRLSQFSAHPPLYAILIMCWWYFHNHAIFPSPLHRKNFNWVRRHFVSNQESILLYLHWIPVFRLTFPHTLSYYTILREVFETIHFATWTKRKPEYILLCSLRIR